MRLIGKGNVDEFGKVFLDKDIMKILGVDPGEQVVFAKDIGTGVRVIKSGMDLSTEVDDYGGPLASVVSMIGSDLKITVSAFCVALLGTVASVITTGFLHTGASFVAFFGFIISFIALFCMWRDLSHVRQDSNPGGFVPKSGQLSDDRLIGITKIMSDTVDAECKAFMYPLFGTCPTKLSAELVSQQGSSTQVRVENRGEKAGISEFDLRFPVLPEYKRCVLNLNAVYVYRKKAIVLDAKYDLSFSDDYTIVDMHPMKKDAVLSFDDSYQKAEFRTGLYDPSGEEKR